MPATMRRLLLAVLAASALAVAATGCAGGSDFPAFDREQTADDLLPADFAVELDQFDPDSTRFVGSHDGVDYFLVTSVEIGSEGPCLVISDGPQNSLIGCGAGGRTTLETGGGTMAELAPAGQPAGKSEGWTRISENVAVRDAE